MYQLAQTMVLKAKQFVRSGIYEVTGPNSPAKYLVSAAPIPTALAMIALATGGREFQTRIRLGAHYLENVRLPDAGWGNTPAGPSNPLATEICARGLFTLEQPVNLQILIHDAACLVAKTWTQDFDRLAPEWLPKQNSPVLKLLEAIAGRSLVPTLDTITLKDIKDFGHFMPPYGRPTMLGVTLIREYAKQGLSSEVQQASYDLLEWMSPNGSWCEDVIVTALAIMALHLVGLNSRLAKTYQWLVRVQYDHGGWPSFNQLINWVAAWGAYILGKEEPNLLKVTTPYLLQALNRDGSLGTTPPYSYPDLDDTAVGLLGLAADPGVESQVLLKMRGLLIQLQNGDGSWSTFPSFNGMPPDNACQFPVYIKSEDITVHALQALLETGLPLSHPSICKGVAWLLKHQRRDGTWDSTWFLGRTYATAQVLDFLLAASGDSPQVAQGISCLLASQESGHWDMGSAGETGLAAYTLLRAGVDPQSSAITDSIEYLASLQLSDGSFRPFYSGFYASGLYYEEPLSEAMAAIRALDLYLKKIRQLTLLG